jgi:hypothetical protein
MHVRFECYDLNLLYAFILLRRLCLFAALVLDACVVTVVLLRPPWMRACLQESVACCRISIIIISPTKP